MLWLRALKFFNTLSKTNSILRKNLHSPLFPFTLFMRFFWLKTPTLALLLNLDQPTDAENHLCRSEEWALSLQIKRKLSECEKPNLHYWSTLEVEENHGHLRFKLLLQICTYEKLSHGITGKKELELFGRVQSYCIKSGQQ